MVDLLESELGHYLPGLLLSPALLALAAQVLSTRSNHAPLTTSTFNKSN